MSRHMKFQILKFDMTGHLFFKNPFFRTRIIVKWTNQGAIFYSPPFLSISVICSQFRLTLCYEHLYSFLHLTYKKIISEQQQKKYQQYTEKDTFNKQFDYHSHRDPE